MQIHVILIRQLNKAIEEFYKSNQMQTTPQSAAAFLKPSRSTAKCQTEKPG